MLPFSLNVGQTWCIRNRISTLVVFKRISKMEEFEQIPVGILEGNLQFFNLIHL